MASQPAKEQHAHGFRDAERKQEVRDRFEKLAESREKWVKKNRYYYEERERYFRFLVPEGLKVLDVGVGLGDLLASLKPSRGVGIDLSARMVKIARERHPDLTILQQDADGLHLDETFDAIIMADLIGHLEDVQEAFSSVAQNCHPDTRLYLSFHNYLWEPVLQLGESMHLKMPQRVQNWLTFDDVENLLGLAGFEVVKTERRLLLPKRIPLLAGFCNRFLAFLPGIRGLCLSNFVVARPIPQPVREMPSASIVIPCRNERGNIDEAIRRIPEFAPKQEVIFVDGHSTDGTPEEIERVIKAYPGKEIRFMVQDGKGKGDAVRKGFAAATGDALMILDADLTMPPEDLPKFYQALVEGRGDFINGCRLIYQMSDQAMRFLNLMGNKFFSLAFSWLLNQRIKDTLCGTKVLYRKDYERIAAGRGYFGDFDPFGDFDLLFGAAKLNLKIVELPIRYQDRSYGATNISRFSHGWLLLKMTVYAFFKLKAV